MLKKLFEPITMNGKTIRNRFAVPAMVQNFCNEDGTCTERFTAYHEAKGNGGFGLIITEDFAVAPNGKGFKYLPGLWNDGQITGFTECTKRVKATGATFVAQIYHCGRQTSRAVIGEAPWSASAIPCPFSPDMPHEMTIDEIKKTVSDYGDCARRAKQAGLTVSRFTARTATSSHSLCRLTRTRGRTSTAVASRTEYASRLR